MSDDQEEADPLDQFNDKLRGYSGTVPFRDKRGRFQGSGRIRRGTGKGFFSGTLEKGLANFERKTGDGVAESSLNLAERIQQYARDNAPWEDQTGDARAGLTAGVEIDGNECSISLQHTVSYGIWLEIRWGGRYAIIIPTIEQLGPEIYREMQGMCGKIIYYVD